MLTELRCMRIVLYESTRVANCNMMGVKCMLVDIGGVGGANLVPLKKITSLKFIPSLLEKFPFELQEVKRNLIYLLKFIFDS